MTQSKYVGIDQSYSGFAFAVVGDDPEDYTVYCRGFDPKKYGSGVTRLLEIDVQISKWILESAVNLIEHVCVEGYAPGSKFGREAAGELGATVKRSLYDYDLLPTIVAPTSLKKFVLGKGVGGKNEMLLGVYKRWGVEFDNDNEADAYGLAQLARLCVHPDEAKFAYEREVLSKLTLETERFPRV